MAGLLYAMAAGRKTRPTDVAVLLHLCEGNVIAFEICIKHC